MGFAYRILGPDGLGIWSLIAAMTAFLDLGTFGLATALSRFLPIALAQSDDGAVAKIVATVGTSLAVLVALLALLAYFPLSIALGKIVGVEHFAVAHTVLICSLVGVWLKALASSACYALIGAHRTPAKCKLMIVAWCLRLLVTISLLKIYGILALPLGLLIGNLVVVLAGWRLLQHALLLSFSSFLEFDQRTFVKLGTYGVRLQSASLATSLFEPTTRLVVSWSSGLETLAIYDMASRLATHVRQLIVGAVQVAVPAVAKVGQGKPELLGSIYDQMVDGAWLGGSLVMACVCVCIPLISEIWLGTMHPLFITLGWSLVIGWWLTLFGVPAYMLAMGLGWSDIILVSQWTMALTGIILILAGSYAWGALGVSIGVAAALLMSTLILIKLTMQRVTSALCICPIARCWRFVLTVMGFVACGLFWFPMGTSNTLSALALATLSLPILSLAATSHRLRGVFIRSWPSSQKIR